MEVFLNGRFVPQEQAAINVADAGFQHGVGLFETMAVCHGRAFRLQQHLSRLAASAEALGLAQAMNVVALAEAVDQTVARNQLDRARLRLTVTAGPISLLRGGPTQPPLPTLLIVPSEPTQYDPDYFERGITVLIAPPAANPFDAMAGHKTLNYWPRLRTLRQAAGAGAGEAIWLNITNHLASGAVSNVFLVDSGRLLTPLARGEEADGALPAPVLPGVTRAAVMEMARSMGIEVEARMLSVAEMLDADEVFLTNSSWHVLPVTRVEKKEIANGQVGEMTRRLRAGLLELIEKETQEGGGS